MKQLSKAQEWLEKSVEWINLSGTIIKDIDEIIKGLVHQFEYQYTEDKVKDFFEVSMDCSVRTYIKRRKLAFAHYLLSMTNYSIVDVIGICNYSLNCDQPYFTRAFKKIFGVTPKEIKRRPLTEYVGFNSEYMSDVGAGAYGAELEEASNRVSPATLGYEYQEDDLDLDAQESNDYNINSVFYTFENYQRMVNLYQAQSHYGFTRDEFREVIRLMSTVEISADDACELADQYYDISLGGYEMVEVVSLFVDHRRRCMNCEKENTNKCIYKRDLSSFLSYYEACQEYGEGVEDYCNVMHERDRYEMETMKSYSEEEEKEKNKEEYEEYLLSDELREKRYESILSEFDIELLEEAGEDVDEIRYILSVYEGGGRLSKEQYELIRRDRWV